MPDLEVDHRARRRLGAHRRKLGDGRRARALDQSVEAAIAMCKNGIDVLELGVPYSDPVMDGLVIQHATEQALENGFKLRQVFDAVKRITNAVETPVLVMTYWNPIEKFGVEKFAHEIAARGGSGVIHPDITIEESGSWLAAADKEGINPIYVVALSTSDDRLAKVTSKCGGFVYAASIMGVTGARASVSTGAEGLVSRIRTTTDLPVAVGLGVSTREQARDVAAYADGVIVGSAFVRAILDSPTLEEGLTKVTELARELALGVRGQ